jgi:hypothetical protein
LLIVFERTANTGQPEVVRVLVPPQSACLQAVSEVANEVFGGSGTTLKIPSPTCEADYVGDTLFAVMRQGTKPGPVFSVVGHPVGPHALVAGAIRFPGTDEWHQLFPFAYIASLAEMRRDYLS